MSQPGDDPEKRAPPGRPLVPVTATPTTGLKRPPGLFGYLVKPPPPGSRTGKSVSSSVAFNPVVSAPYTGAPVSASATAFSTTTPISYPLLVDTTTPADGVPMAASWSATTVTTNPIGSQPHPPSTTLTGKSRPNTSKIPHGKHTKSKRGRGRTSKGSSRKSATTVKNQQQRKDLSSAEAGPLVHITSDEFPNRIVNPLLDLPSDHLEPVHGSELLAWTDLVFAPPDTYPLSYLGRLLGLDIPSSESQEFPTEMKVDELQFLDRSQDPFFQIPELGLAHSPSTRNDTSSKLGDDDDRYTLDHVDPVYTHFLRRGFDRSQCRTGSGSLLSRLAASNITAATRALIFEAAKDWLDTNVWTFEEWTTATAGDAQWTLEDDDGQTVVAAPPPNYFGIMAKYLGQPIFLLHYNFQWYPIQETKESELVLILEGIVKRSGTITTVEDTTSPKAGVGAIDTSATTDPSSAQQGNSNVPSRPLTQDVSWRTPPATLPDVELPDSVRWMMLTLVLEHARAAGVWYCLWDVPHEMVAMNEHCFRMTRLSKAPAKFIPMVGDMLKCSWKYAVLKYQEGVPGDSKVAIDTSPPNDDTFQQRVLIRFPLEEEAKSLFDASVAETQRSKRGSTTKADSKDFTSARGLARELVVGVRAELSGNTDVNLRTLNAMGEEGELVLNSVAQDQPIPELDILRRFPFPVEECKMEDHEDGILKELIHNQDVLLKAESALEPRIRALMQRVIDERIAYEMPEVRAKRAEDLRILQDHEDAMTRRKELDQAEQEQRELDMNAVCSICNDGEVTPDNQILFCEACDVPVHQFCYGIEEIPEGDYYCIPCRRFERDKMSKEQERTSSTGARIALPPLPINCELCPIKKGAYVRSGTSQSVPKSEIAKWVHMACAKWQGLNFVVPEKPDVVEDVSELKKYFRRMDIECDICKGKRGAYHQCRQPGCEKYMHLSCARAIGVCEVVHGENVEGPVETNPWTLMCAEHSNLEESADEHEERLSMEQLIELARELPNDPIPEPILTVFKPFNKLTGKERTLSLKDSLYEAQFLEEILKKRFAGNRCEVCWTMEDDGKNLARCSDCQSVICFACRISDKGEVNPDQKYFKCFSCRFVREKTKTGEEYEPPHCVMCNQRSGLLLKSFAIPAKMTHWKNNPQEFEKTFFARDIWSHYTCAYWLTHTGLVIYGDTCQVNISNVVMSNGRGLIRAKQICHLCGLGNGLKAQCADSNCRATGEKRLPYRFHVTCAREAGYEVDDEKSSFFLKCYFHGACAYNLRARLEDFMEVEKRRAGSTFSRSDAPMTFSDGSRLLNQAIVVLRILGWAWRWAEHWVEWGSNWEPLLEEGQKEEQMTKQQLKIIDSTPESRAEDARRCRLSAFGAAIRNRAFDTENGVDNDSLCRALTAVLSTQSLVGPLTPQEISLAIDWLSRAYRSKSKFLGLGEDKIDVATDGFCVHRVDKSPKYELGDRPLPGKAPLEPDQIFESKVDEPDDFLLPEISMDGAKCSLPPNSIREVKRKVFKFKQQKPGRAEERDEDETRTQIETKYEKQTLKKKGVVVDKSWRKSGRQRKDDEQKVPSRFDSVAALVPSAVKKRGTDRPESQLWTPVESKAHPAVVRRPTPSRMVKELFSTKRELGVPTAIAHVLYQDLVDASNEDSVLLRVGRRGRPPKFIDFVVYVKLNGEDFFAEKDAVGDPEAESVQEMIEETVQEAVLEAVHETMQEAVQEAADEGVQATTQEIVQEPPRTSANKTPRKADAAEAGGSSTSDDSKTPQIASGGELARASGSEELATETLAPQTTRRRSGPSAKPVEAPMASGRFPGRVRRSTDHFIPSPFTTKSSYDGDDTDSSPRPRRRNSDAVGRVQPKRKSIDGNVDLKEPSSPRLGRSPQKQKKHVRSPGNKRENIVAKSSMKGRERSPKPGKKLGRPEKHKVEVGQESPSSSDAEVSSSDAEISSSDTEVYVLRAKKRGADQSPGTPSPSKRRIRRSARSPGRPLLDHDEEKQLNATLRRST